jgi:hypothetical protein
MSKNSYIFYTNDLVENQRQIQYINDKIEELKSNYIAKRVLDLLNEKRYLNSVCSEMNFERKTKKVNSKKCKYIRQIEHILRLYTEDGIGLLMMDLYQARECLIEHEAHLINKEKVNSKFLNNQLLSSLTL